jgi:hypothetical protein
MVNDHSVVIHKAGYKKGRRHDHIQHIRITTLSLLHKLLL